LGVDPGASRDFIKRQFRTLAKRYHPDTNPDDPSAAEQFRRLTAAYAIRTNQEQRRKYDRGRYQPTGEEWQDFRDATTDIGEEQSRWERYFENNVQWQVESAKERRATTPMGRFVSEVGVFFGDLGIMTLTMIVVSAVAAFLLWGIVTLDAALGLYWLAGVH
jgi:curved DNA-binding protein CbpA